MHRHPPARPSGLHCSANEHGRSANIRPRLRAMPRLLTAAIVALGVIALPTTAGAQDELIAIDFDDVVFASAGAVVPVGSVAVASNLQGRTCRASVVTANQSSIHPENDLLIATGGSTARVEDVEDFTDGTNSWLVDLTLGSSIDMSVEMGPDGISSLGFTVEVDCSKPLVGTTVPVLSSSVTTTTTSTTVTSETTATTGATTSQAPTTTSQSTTSESTTSQTTATPETTSSTATTNSAPSSTQLQVQETTTTVAAAGSSTTVSSTTAPTVTIPSTVTTQPAEATTTTVSQGQLEQSPPASAVPAQPSYTG